MDKILVIIKNSYKWSPATALYVISLHVICNTSSVEQAVSSMSVQCMCSAGSALARLSEQSKNLNINLVQYLSK